MSTATADVLTPSIQKNTGYLRIATEEAYAPAEMLRLYRKLLDEKGTDDPGFLSQWGYFLGRADRMQVLAERFHNLDEGRIRDMDATGIARQIVSLTSPGVQIFDAATGTALATTFNDQLAEACHKHPTRFSGLCCIAPQNPAAAAKELERSVTKLGLKGAIINSNTHGEYLDDPKFYDILATAEALDVPIYLHPATAPRRMIGPMIEKGLEGAFYGFAVETSVHLLRMIMSGVFDRFPKLQIIAGHGGEGLPFWLCRFDLFQHNYAINNRFPNMPKLQRTVSEYIKQNIPITSSGMAWAPVIQFCQQVLGVDRVMYAMDYPYQYNAAEVKVTDDMPISDADKKKFYQTNAERFFHLT
jgi:2,3-dihydroxybenzoate decarboxylase